MKARSIYQLLGLYSIGTLCCVNLALAAPRVEFGVSKVHALLFFVEGISGDPHSPPHLKALFEASRFNTQESQEQIRRFNDLTPFLEKSFKQEGLPKERTSHVSIQSLVLTQSAFATNLADFQQRTLGLLPLEESNSLIQVLSFFEPVYEKLIWQPNLKKLNRAATSMRKKSNQWNLDSLFSRASTFYRSRWPASQPFFIRFYPVPKGAHESRAQSLGAFESVGMVVGHEDLEHEFGVIFHELCHSLYDAQGAEFQSQLSGWFLKHPSPFAKLAYTWLDESVATAIGNGWAYRSATGKLDPAEWYHQDKINGFAHVLYPKIVEYLEAGKSMDEPFAEFAIQAFEKTFPHATSEIESLMGDVVLLTDGSFGPSQELRRELRNRFQILSMNSGSPIDDEISKQIVRENSASTVFLIATRPQVKQIHTLESVLPGLSKAVSLAKESGAAFGLFDINNQKVLVLLLDQPSQLISAVKQLASLAQLSKSNQFVPLRLNETAP
jgi:uncharacterized protein YozE (UPF0346 family)